MEKSRRWELQPLSLLFLASALLDIGALLTIRLPGQPAALIFPGNTATPFLFAGVHIGLSFGAVFYAAARSLQLTLSKRDVQRALRWWFPLWTVAITAVIITVIALCNDHGILHGSERTAGAQRTGVFFTEFAVSIISIVLVVRFLAQTVPDWIDFTLLLTMLAGVTGLVINAEPLPRFSPPWVVSQLLYLGGASFVLIAAIHDLVVRFGDSLRIESEALQLRAVAFEQNTIVETALLKSRFVAMVSHELRTPLGGIIGMSELLEREPLTERQHRFTSAIRTSANGLHRVVDDLLDFSRVESGRIELEDAAFDLERMLDDIVVLYSEQARVRNISLNAYVDPILPRSIRGDQMRLKQVLQNLVSNALRFTNDGSVRIECVSDVNGDDTLLQFYVSDTGIGIGPAAIDRIFDAFVQEDATTARRFGGTGLGLSIAKHLVELMGGTISVWSEVGIGTTFAFTLPARSGDDAVDSAPRSLRDIAVLVFDENPDSQMLLQRYVGGWDMRAVAASTLAEAHAALAAESAARRRFDLLLVGPGVRAADAAAFIRDARTEVAASPARAIFIHHGGVPERAATAAGFDICLSEPFRQSELFDAIVRLRRNGFAARIVPTIEGVPARTERRERILVAEDNEINQTLLCAQLEHLGFRADLVSDGEAAVAAAVDTDYDLIFMDCEMPGIDGFEATRRIRASTHRGVRIVAVTAHASDGYRETCLDAGMSDYLAKPALIGPLTAIVDRWLPPETDPPITSAPNPVVSRSEAQALTHMRDRLREVFHGDQARIDRVLASSLRSLLDGAAELHSALQAQDLMDAGKTAHRLKGVALEIGSSGIAEQARAIESAVQLRTWDAAERAHERFVEMVEATSETLDHRA